MRDDGAGDPLDALIDDTAKSLTGGALPGSLRANVRERIGPTRARRRVPVWQMSAAAASATVLIVGWTVLGPSRESDRARPQDASVIATPDAAPPVLAPPQRVTPPERVTPPPVVRAAASPRGVPRPSAIPGVVAASAADAQVVIEPLVIELLTTEPLDLDLMETPMPLRAELIDIDPIVVQ